MTIDNGEIVNRGVKSFDDTIKDLNQLAENAKTSGQTLSYTIGSRVFSVSFNSQKDTYEWTLNNRPLDKNRISDEVREELASNPTTYLRKIAADVASIRRIAIFFVVLSVLGIIFGMFSALLSMQH